jgi:hypothetical protein
MVTQGLKISWQVSPFQRITAGKCLYSHFSDAIRDDYLLQNFTTEKFIFLDYSQLRKEAAIWISSSAFRFSKWSCGLLSPFLPLREGYSPPPL